MSTNATPPNPELVHQNSHPIPTTTAHTLFPTPSLTSSLDTPSTGSMFPTPVHPTLFPSPDIMSSPVMRSSRRRVARGKLISKYATLTPMSEPDLIGGSELPELTPDHRDARYTRIKTRSGYVAQLHEPGSSRKELVQMEDSILRGTDHHANEDWSQVSHSGLSPNKPSTSVPPIESERLERSSPVSSTKEDSTESLLQGETLSSATFQGLNDSKQSKRAREEDNDRTPAIRKKARTFEESDTLASDTKAESSNQIDELLAVGRTTRSQARAVAALLALSTSKDDSSPVYGMPKEEALQDEIPKTPIARRTSDRLKHRSQLVNETSHQVPSKNQREEKSSKHSVVGRAPSRIVHAPSGGVTETLSSAPADAGVSSNTRAKSKSGRTSQQAKSSQVCDGELEVGNIDQNQEVNHVPVPSDLLPRPDPSVVYAADGSILQRTFPEDLPIHESYPRWYRRNPVSAYFLDDDPARSFVLGEAASAKPVPGWTPNAAPYFNLYTPRFVHGKSIGKVGLCTICVEPVWRGGEGRNVVLNTKISQYNYHMQYYHGISPKTGLPFSPPIAFRQTERKPSRIKCREREVVEEGKCHACEKWIPIETITMADVLVRELFWWKHAACCHGTDRLAGDNNPYIEDNVYLKLQEYEEFCKKNEERTEELRSEGDSFGSPRMDGVGLEPEEDGGQTDTLPLSETTSMDQGGFVRGDDQECLTDSDSDLTDLDEEAEAVCALPMDDGA
ncbi:DUF4451 domain protein [Rhizoctonia solani AG-3 Rhs1AP]|uniref:DUF4451 domain protein n=1 Tax=Rhizoctonia solani AG-3 Rhs1AP TaxID=1086054 RepID=X8J4I5_9AGAM|nr:DUF4451 domain protein [Rhizoctonia solani AG-3 Rhs1AP]